MTYLLFISAEHLAASWVAAYKPLYNCLTLREGLALVQHGWEPCSKCLMKK